MTTLAAPADDGPCEICCDAKAEGELVLRLCGACKPVVSEAINSLWANAMAQDGAQLSAARRGALRRARDVARKAIEVALVLSDSGNEDAGLATAMDRINRYWVGLHSHKEIQAQALGEVTFLVMWSAGSGNSDLTELREQLDFLWPEFAARMKDATIASALKAWASQQGNAGKWKALATLLQEAGIRRKRPVDKDATAVQAEFGRWEKSGGGRLLRKALAETTFSGSKDQT